MSSFFLLLLDLSFKAGCVPLFWEFNAFFLRAIFVNWTNESIPMNIYSLGEVKGFRASKNKTIPDYFRPSPFLREFVEILNLFIITWRTHIYSLDEVKGFRASKNKTIPD